MGDNLRTRTHVYPFEGGGRGKNALSGSDEHVIRGEGIICSFIWFIPLDVFCSTVGAVSLQEMEVFTDPGRPFARLQDAAPQQAGPLMSAAGAQRRGEVSALRISTNNSSAAR